VSKASALALLAERHGVDAADVVAFGDMPNDLPMLAWAGRAYGVRTGHPDVLAAVERVVDGPEDDGVARELERLFALR
jgi:hydroxymethylpyrimidine pyrophosphatase-like HAD family hydrolase